MSCISASSVHHYTGQPKVYKRHINENDFADKLSEHTIGGMLDKQLREKENLSPKMAEAMRALTLYNPSLNPFAPMQIANDMKEKLSN